MILPVRSKELSLSPEASIADRSREDRSTRMNESGPRLLHELFEAQVRVTPEAPALAHQDEVLTYRQLDEAANRLAHRLLGLGVGRESPVIIAASPSIDSIIGLLAILKAGAVYVPVDPAVPPARAKMIREDTGAKVILTQRSLLSLWSEYPHEVLLLEEIRQAANEFSSNKPALSLSPDHLAYMMYTSGTTGIPKGVMVPHRGITNTMRYRQQALPQHPGDRQLQNFSLAFDASIGEIFGPLQAGGCLVVAEGDSIRDSGRFVETIIRRGITIVGINPSRLRLVLDHPRIRECVTLRRVMVGGEPLLPEDRSRLFSVLDVELHNLYGPTEVSLDATHWDARQGCEDNVVPIGFPITHAEAYILDSHLKPLGVGSVGELYIGGAGLARGYLNNPALTAERFVPNPFSRQPGSRLYRTGDACSWRSDGTIQFHGRVDQQVKIRGYRIELEEIESVLRTHPAVREAVVLATPDSLGEAGLVAYIVPRSDGRNDVSSGPPPMPTSALRAYLRDYLPDYMIPTVYVPLFELPRSASGKVDRQALPRPQQQSFNEPAKGLNSTSLEQYLRQLWAEVLGHSQFGDQDHFFDVGGNSLKVAFLIQRLEKDLGEYVYTVALYDAPTITALADYLRVNYPVSVQRLFGMTTAQPAVCEERHPIDEGRFTAFAAQVKRLGAREPKNPPAVFVLSPPRSGSTLFRVMLGGHPRLFAPPELQLLNYNTLKERRAALDTDRDRFWLEGTIRAIMEIRKCSDAEATRIMENCENRNLTVKDFYALLQSWLGDVTFVDKTPTYAFDLNTLRRAEDDFRDAKFIHLIRHPSPMMASFEEAKLHVFMPPFFHGSLPANVWEFAELIWLLCHRNILRFLEEIPAERKYAVRFEELVTKPREVMQGVAAFLGLEFHEHMADPYNEKNKSRMTDAINPLGRMLGDVKFHSHGAVQATQAERKKGRYPEEKLSKLTRELAERLGYTFSTSRGDRPADQRSVSVAVAPLKSSSSPRPGVDQPPSQSGATVAVLQPKGDARPLFCVHPGGGGVSCYQRLSRLLEPEIPVYAFQAAGLDHRSGAAGLTVPEMAAAYIAQMQRIQPQGPYRIAGWSIGGVIAFEMALQLWHARQDVELLAAIDSVVLDSTQPHPPLLAREVLSEFASGFNLRIRPRRLSRIPLRGRLNYLYRMAQAQGLLPASVTSKDFRSLYLRQARVFRENVSAVRSYRPSGKVPRVVLFVAGDRLRPAAPGPTLSWHALADVVDQQVIPGTHYSILREPYVEELARRLRGYLLRSTPTAHRPT